MTPPVTVVGAGPVGLLLACLLGKQGREVRVHEKRRERSRASMAIGITPPSLDILATLDLKDAFLRRGVRIARAQVFEARRPCGILDFRSSENEILSLPQFGTRELLLNRLRDFPAVTLLEGSCWEASDTADHPGWVVACDGSKSGIRRAMGFRTRQKTYPVTFVMSDFPDEEGLGPDARLYFTPRGAVESFPLPERRRRWIAQCVNGAQPDLSTLQHRVHAASGVDLRGRAHGPLCAFTPQRCLARTFHTENVVLCGDAAHTMCPIGGQGMNTGFADAWHLSQLPPDFPPEALAAYTQARRRAFRAASRRAAAGMWLGTRTGRTWSAVRRHLLGAALHHPKTHRTLALAFAMRNLPPA